MIPLFDVDVKGGINLKKIFRQRPCPLHHASLRGSAEGKTDKAGDGHY
jgi:hypothetical protein